MAIVVVGQGMVYWANPYSHGISVNVSGDSVDFDIRSTYDTEYTVLVLDNGDFTMLDKLYIYYDEGYGNDPRITYSSQKDYCDNIVAELTKRGFTNYAYVSAEDLAGVVSSAGAGTGMLFTSGAFPETVYDGTDSCGLMKWLASGGSMYWNGGEVGRYISATGGLTEVSGYQTLFFGKEGCLNETDSEPGYERSKEAVSSVLRLTANNIGNGLVLGLDDTLYLGYNDGVHCSMSLMKKGEGQIAIMGGSFDKEMRMSLSQLIASKISYSTTMVASEDDYTKNNTAKCTIQVLLPYTHTYSYLGGFLLTYGRAI